MKRALALFAAIALASCVIGPKHDDPSLVDVPGGFDGNYDAAVDARGPFEAGNGAESPDPEGDAGVRPDAASLDAAPETPPADPADADAADGADAAGEAGADARDVGAGDVGAGDDARGRDAGDAS
jgi:hypothetical protein